MASSSVSPPVTLTRQNSSLLRSELSACAQAFGREVADGLDAVACKKKTQVKLVAIARNIESPHRDTGRQCLGHPVLEIIQRHDLVSAFQ